MWLTHKIRRLSAWILLRNVGGNLNAKRAGRARAALLANGITTDHLTDDEVFVRIKLFADEYANRRNVTIDQLRYKMEISSAFSAPTGTRKVHTAKPVGD